MKSLLILLIAVFVSSVASAQIDIGGKIKDKTQQRIEDKTNQGIDKGLDKTEEGINGVFKKKDKDKDKDKDNNESKDDAGNDEGDGGDSGESGDAASNETVTSQKLESYTQYDFVPGDQVLFYEDFSQDAIGDFPALWTSNSGGEVKTVNIAPGKWFHMNGDDAVFCFNQDLTLPDNFIIEFDIIPDAVYSRGIVLSLYQTNPENVREIEDASYAGVGGVNIIIEPDGWYTTGYATSKEWLEGQSNKNPVVKEKVNHVIIWIQKRRVRIYHLGAKVLDIPTNLYPETKINRFRFNGWDRGSKPMVSNFKITTAAPDTRSKLLTEGKLISYGIYFDSGKDVVKPESYGALKDIANVLKENPDVKIKVVGHTDSDGDDASNLDLSKRRAANVKNAMTKDFGIDGGRIETDGMGESQPIGPNDNPENKAKNRRVEFIKL